MNKHQPYRLWVFLSILLSLVALSLQNQSQLAQSLPYWPWMVVMFWALTMPTRINIGTAFIVGLLCDSLLAQPIGLFALLFSISAYFMTVLSAHYKGLPIAQQSLYVGIIYACVHLSSDVFLHTLRSDMPFEWNLWPVGIALISWGVIQHSLERFARITPIE